MKHWPGSWLLWWTSEDVISEEASEEDAIPKGTSPSQKVIIREYNNSTSHVNTLFLPIWRGQWALRYALVIIRPVQFPDQRGKGSLKPEGLAETFLPANGLSQKVPLMALRRGGRLSLALLRVFFFFFAPFLQCWSSQLMSWIPLPGNAVWSFETPGPI